MKKELFASWRTSLSLLRPANFKTLARAIGNTWVKAWTAGWMYVVPIYLFWTSTIFVQNESISNFLNSLFAIAITAFFIAAARPSTQRKDKEYFWQVFRDYIVCILLLKAAKFFVPIDVTKVIQYVYGNITAMLFCLILFSLTDISICFLMDSKPWNVRSYLNTARNSVVFIFYNLPLMLILGLLHLGGASFYVLITSGLEAQFQASVAFVLFWPCINYLALSVLDCMWVNIYTKRIHDDPTLYKYE